MKHDDVDPALLNRISQNIAASLRPVRPLPPTGVLVAALVAACILIATAGGLVLGPHGIAKMGAEEIGQIFLPLLLLTGLAAWTYISEMIPGSPRLTHPWIVILGTCLTLLAVFALIFPDHHVDDFVHAGIKCLTAGLLQAVPIALAAWLILRRGFAVNRTAAGLAAGVLAGVGGVTMLEIHCDKFEALHVMVWHTAVVPLSAALLALVFYSSRITSMGRSRDVTRGG